MSTMKLGKITTQSDGGPKRRYDDACGTAHALELVGERWALLIVRELMLGPKRFSDLRADLPGLSANVLTQRLEGLEATGILTRRRLPPPAPAQVYALTPWGLEAETFVKSMGRWAARSPGHDPTMQISATSTILSFRTMFEPTRAAGFNALVGLRMDDQSFFARFEDGTMIADRTPAGGSIEDADVILTGSPRAVAGFVHGGQPLDAMVAAGALQIHGDRAVAERFATLFPLPDKIALPPTARA